MNYLMVLFALLIPVTSSAQGTSQDAETEYPQRVRAGTLLSACTSSALTAEERERRRYCAAFISGIEEGVRLLEHARGEKSTVCPSTWVTSRGLVDAYMNYAAKHRDKMHEPAASLVLDALREAYPCSLTQ